MADPLVKFDAKLQRWRDVETGQIVGTKVFKNIGHAAASIRKFAIRSIKTSEAPSRRGRPPHTRKKRRLQTAIVYDLDPQRKVATIGPRKSVVGMSAKVHEFGGRYYKTYYEARPFMLPALLKNMHRFGGGLSGSLGR